VQGNQSTFCKIFISSKFSSFISLGFDEIQLKELALKEVNPHLMTIATLTGHAVLAVGKYTVLHYV
jgi:hypothetical protein